VRLDASSGSALALGVCLGAQGKTASAWSAYLNAASLARRDGQKDREHAATTRAKALEPKLSRVTLDVAAATRDLPALEVREDDVVINSAAWTGQPVDPGSHTLVVTARGKKPYTTTFLVSAAGGSQTVLVPALDDEPVTETPTPPPPNDSQKPDEAPKPAESSGLRTAGFVIGGLGAAALVTGGVFGVLALQKIRDVNQKCPSSPCPDGNAVSDDHSAGTFADVSTVTIIAGGAAVVGGVIMVLASPKHADAKTGMSTHPVIVLGPTGGTVGVGGAF
jgi:hypothetical protein